MENPQETVGRWKNRSTKRSREHARLLKIMRPSPNLEPIHSLLLWFNQFNAEKHYGSSGYFINSIWPNRCIGQQQVTRTT